MPTKVGKTCFSFATNAGNEAWKQIIKGQGRAGDFFGLNPSFFFKILLATTILNWFQAYGGIYAKIWKPKGLWAVKIFAKI